MAIFVMKFFRYTFSQNTYSSINLSKELFIAFFIIILPLFYPQTANASLFSFISDMATDKASAKTFDIQDAPNSQNMTVLKAALNSNPHPNIPNEQRISASENIFLAEIGPSGTISDIENPINTQISIYIVRSGDTLSEIANMFDVSVNTIVWANDLGKNKTIKEGQTLVILPISGIKHIVKKGDTIKGIVAKYKADIDEILEYNNLSINSVIAEGDVIIVPDAEPTYDTKSSSVNVSSKVPSYVGYYMRPVYVGRKSQSIHGYNGVDLAAPVGTPIYASAGGVVIVSTSDGSWHGGYGNYVVISHPNGTQTLYAHNSTNLVSVGQRVEKGDMIAKLGITGKTTGPHVHFEIRGAKNPF